MIFKKGMVRVSKDKDGKEVQNHIEAVMIFKKGIKPEYVSIRHQFFQFSIQTNADHLYRSILGHLLGRELAVSLPQNLFNLT